MTRRDAEKADLRLWLDDERGIPHPGWERAHNVAEAIAWVESAATEGRAFSEASLDHDLGEGPDGLKFVDYMVLTGRWPLAAPRVHSMNPVGRDRMRATIQRYFTAVRCPHCGLAPEPHRLKRIKKGTGRWHCNRCGQWPGVEVVVGG